MYLSIVFKRLLPNSGEKQHNYHNLVPNTAEGRKLAFQVSNCSAHVQLFSLIPRPLYTWSGNKTDVITLIAQEVGVAYQNHSLHTTPNGQRSLHGPIYYLGYQGQYRPSDYTAVDRMAGMLTLGLSWHWAAPLLYHCLTSSASLHL